MWLKDLEIDLQGLKDQGLLRQLRLCASASEPEVLLDGKKVVQFSSNNYLGLSTHPRVIQSSQDAAARYGTGTGASRLISGTQTPHYNLEIALAQFKATPAALLYGSGSMANVGLLSALGREGDLIILDKADHATLYDGARLSGAEIQRFPHQDLERLTQLLNQARLVNPKQKIIVAVEAVYSMEGDIAPLSDLIKITADYHAILVVDEAHSTGVLGIHGHGIFEHFGIIEVPEHVIITGTLSKALASFGGFVAGPKALIDFLINRSRAFVFATALPASVIAAALQALLEIQAPLKALRIARESLADGLRARGWNIGASQTPILPVYLGSADAAMKVHERLWEAGYYVPAIRAPTVPLGACRLRVSVSAAHTPEQIQGFLGALGSA